MSPGWRSLAQRGLPVAVSAGVLVWLLGRVDLARVAAAVDARVLSVMGPALLAFGAVSLWIEAISIRRLVPGTPPGFDTWTAARIKCASYLPGILHYTVGAGGLALLLRRRTGLSLAESASRVLLIASTDLIVVLTAAGGATALTGIATGTVRTGVAAVVVAGLVAGLALLRAPFGIGPLERVRQLALFEGLRRVPTRRLLELLALRAAFCACFVAGCAAVFVAFEVAVPLAQLVAGIMVVALVAALPIAVAGLGTSNAAFVVVFAGLAPRETLLAMSLALSFGILSLRAAMGVVFARELTREALESARVSEA